MSRRRFFDFLTPLDSITISWVKGMNNAVPFEVKKIFDTYFVKSVTSGIKVKDIIIKSNGIYIPFVNNTNDSWRNIAQNNYHGTIEGVGLQFDSYHGWHNPIGTGWVDIHFNPNIQGGSKFQKDNCGIVLGLFNAQPTLTDTVILNVDATLRIGRYSTGFRARLNNIATSNFDFIGLPFLNGNFSFNRTASNAMNAKNQNTTNTTSAILSSSVPSESMRLFSDGITPYLGGINFVYNGPSLTDAEYTALNNAVNETLIQLLFYKFGNDNWGVKMAKSYFYDLHGFEKYEAWEVYEFIKRMQEDYVTVPVELSVNSGAAGMTDWVDSNADGLADSWNVSSLSYTQPSIVTGNGFTGNAQRIYYIQNASAYHLYFNFTTVVGRAYIFTFKYRSSKSLNISNAFLSAHTVSSNIGNCASVTFYDSGGGGINIRFFIYNAVLGDWFEIDEVSIKEVAESAYYYNTFGPSGQNRQVCDWIMLFKAGGNLLANAWTKTGATLRWNQDGTITSSNTMPAYTRGTNLGIVTVSSTDGWNGMTSLYIRQNYNSVNSFYGNLVAILKLKTGGSKLTLATQYNRIRINLLGSSFKDVLNYMVLEGMVYPGGHRINLGDVIGGSYTNFDVDYPLDWGYTTGDMTLFTNEFKGNIFARHNNVFGSLRNIVLNATSGNFYIYLGYGLTEGLSVWNINYAVLSLSDNKFTTQAILDQLTVQKNQFAITPPIKNLTDNFSGATMGIVPANHQLILDIAAQHAAQNVTFVCQTRTS